MHNFGNIFGNILDLFAMASASTPKHLLQRSRTKHILMSRSL